MPVSTASGVWGRMVAGLRLAYKTIPLKAETSKETAAVISTVMQPVLDPWNLCSVPKIFPCWTSAQIEWYNLWTFMGSFSHRAWCFPSHSLCQWEPYSSYSWVTLPCVCRLRFVLFNFVVYWWTLWLLPHFDRYLNVHVVYVDLGFWFSLMVLGLSG